MKYIMTLIWALLIGSALGYVLASMAGDPFNVTQSALFAAGVFIVILIFDVVLKTDSAEQ